MNDSRSKDEKVLVCPCQTIFNTDDQILNALNDTQCTSELIRWLEGFQGSNDEIIAGGDHNESENKSESNASGFYCKRRRDYQFRDDLYGVDVNSTNNGYHKSYSHSSVIDGTMMWEGISVGGTGAGAGGLNDNHGNNPFMNNQKNPSNQKLNCPHRVHASYCILNGIRDSCRNILESQHVMIQSSNANEDKNGIGKKDHPKVTTNLTNPNNGQSSSTKTLKKTKKKIKPSMISFSNQDVTYEESFPSLGTNLKPIAKSENTILLTARKKKSSQSQQQQQLSKSNKSKRRIRPMSTNSTITTIHTNQQNTSNSNETKSASALGVTPFTSASSTPTDVNNNAKATLSPPIATTSPWNQIITNSGKKDPMERIMNTKTIISPKRNTNQSLQKNQGSNTDVPKSCDEKSSSLESSKIQHEEVMIESKTKTTTKPQSTDSSLAQSIDNESTPTKENQKELLDQPFFQNLVKVYYTIVKCQLLPSVLLELQLILQLLSLQDETVKVNLKDNDESKTDEKKETKRKDSSTISSSDSKSSSSTTKLLRDIFSSPYLCQQFAVTMLIKLKPILANLTQGIILSLLNLKSFQYLVPKELIKYLYDSMEERMILDHHRRDNNNHPNAFNKDGDIINGSRQNQLLGIGNESFGDGSLGSMSKSTILNISFNEQRDSRHRFKSKDLVPLYNNREQCRDIFLFQLRAFQQIRSTVIHPSEIAKSTSQILKQCKDMIHTTLLRRNMSWFVEFFTELLLQIGLVPIQETDADILKNVTDKEKLQKLHSRFTSKVGVVSSSTQRNKSSQRLTLDNNTNEPNGNESNSSGFVRNDYSTPDQHFTGHQEFFYRFIMFVDSFMFSTQLRNRLISVILKMWSSNDTVGLEQRIMHLQMLSKFLGVLTFSPYWTTDDIVEDTILSDSTDTSLKPLIQMTQFVERGWQERKLIVTIPWVLGFCQMIKWDQALTQSAKYHTLFGILRAIHQWAMRRVISGGNSKSSNLFILALYLETFFVQVLGMIDVEGLPQVSLPSTMILDRDGLDELNISFSSSFMNMSSSHLDGLQSLLDDLSRNGENLPVGGKSKKLKPYAISSYPSRESFSFRDDIQGQSLTFNSSPVNNYYLKQNSFTTKMIDSFYHQHKDLQPICNFVIDLSLKNASERITNRNDSQIKSSYLKHSKSNGNKLLEPIDIDWYLQVLRNVEIDTFDSIRIVLNSFIEVYIKESLNVLLSTFVSVQVRKIAIDLSTNFACVKGESIVISYIRVKVKKNIEEHVRKGFPARSSLIQSIDRDHPNLSRLQSRTQFLDKMLKKSIDETSSNDNLAFTEKAAELVRNLTHDIKDFYKCDSMDLELLQDSLKYVLSKLLIYLQNSSKSTMKMIAQRDSPPTGFVEAVELFCLVSELKLCPKEVCAFGHSCCNEIVLGKMLKWKSSDLFMSAIEKSLLSNAIQPRLLKTTIVRKIGRSTITQSESQHYFLLLQMIKKSASKTPMDV